VNYLPDDRAAELRAFFFESASEVLQSLNEAGLELEARPADEEVLRRVRRAVHTLKGDSAACGFTAISEFAHEIEDVLTPEVAEAHGVRLAEVVLAAADAFDELLKACQHQTKPPAVDHNFGRWRVSWCLRGPVATIETPATHTLPAKFDWTGVRTADDRGGAVTPRRTGVHVALRIDPDSHMRAAAFQLVRNVLHSTGTVIVCVRRTIVAAATAEKLSKLRSPPLQAEDKIITRCKIPSIVSDVRVERVSSVTSPEQELLTDLLEAQSTAAAATAT